jgi:hypothetical protein
MKKEGSIGRYLAETGIGGGVGALVEYGRARKGEDTKGKVMSVIRGAAIGGLAGFGAGQLGRAAQFTSKAAKLPSPKLTDTKLLENTTYKSLADQIVGMEDNVAKKVQEVANFNQEQAYEQAFQSYLSKNPIGAFSQETTWKGFSKELDAIQKGLDISTTDMKRTKQTSTAAWRALKKVERKEEKWQKHQRPKIQQRIAMFPQKPSGKKPGQAWETQYRSQIDKLQDQMHTTDKDVKDAVIAARTHKANVTDALQQLDTDVSHAKETLRPFTGVLHPVRATGSSRVRRLKDQQTGLDDQLRGFQKQQAELQAKMQKDQADMVARMKQQLKKDIYGKWLGTF